MDASLCPGTTIFVVAHLTREGVRQGSFCFHDDTIKGAAGSRARGAKD